MKRYTERERERLVVESESWNGSVADFCRQRGVSEGSLAPWRRRCGERGRGSKDEAGRGTWIPVEVEAFGPDVVEGPRYVLVSPAGARMEVGAV
jgi:transposase-like protein